LGKMMSRAEQDIDSIRDQVWSGGEG
jgi:hypothetical protein